jgi:hypothetical protein
MSASYWKTAGEAVAKGLGENTIRRFGVGGKLLGRTGAVLGIGFLAYELFKNYKENIEKEPAYKEMVILQREMEKWASAISCLGREAFEAKEYGSFDEGGAINALYRKKGLGSTSVKPADPAEACILIGRAVDYIVAVENLFKDNSFEDKREALISQLERIQNQLNTTKNYKPIQIQLSRIVDEIRPIESGYASRIYDCSREIQKTLGSNAAWAAISMTTLGIIKKPEF